MTKAKLIKWLEESWGMPEIKQVIRLLNEWYEYELALSRSKAELLEQLGSGGPSKARLVEAFEEVFGLGEEDIEELIANEAEDDDEEWDENEDDDDDEDDEDDDEEWDDDDDEWGESWYDDVDDDDQDVLREQLASEIAYSKEHAEQPARPYQDEARKTVLKKLSPGQPALLHVATGGGKTRIANDIIVDMLKKKRGGWVLWLAPSWDLLYQAARDLARRNKGYVGKIARIGGTKDKLPGVPEDFEESRVRFTTTSTFIQRARTGYFQGDDHPVLVVWDECHLGETAKMGKVLLDRRRWRDTPILGLTATPRHPDDGGKFQVVFSRSFSQLVQDGYLARPEIQEVKTNRSWTPRLYNNLIKPESLRELEEDDKRNQKIVSFYEKNQGTLGKTLVFCCSVNHANLLAKMFNDQIGIPARPISYLSTTVEANAIIRQFRNGDLLVVTNMAKLTHGVDIPDIETIFLCRPTASDILFSQMIGRGCRRTEEKVMFNIVEFTDNVRQHGEILRNAKKYFVGAALAGERAASTYTPVKPIPRHEYDPRGKPTWIPDRFGVPENLRGLWYRQDQTFGIEFELTRDDFGLGISDRKWRSVAEQIRKGLVEVLGNRVGKCYRNPKAPRDSSVWNVVYDGSCGWEVVSRILKNRQGFEEVLEVCQALEGIMLQTGLKVNYETGTHVHFGWLGRDAAELVRAVRLARAFEPALATLVSPSRLVSFDGHRYDVSEPNFYCRPIASVISERDLGRVKKVGDFWNLLDPDVDRYTTFNIVPLDSIHTVEVRFHSGTVEASKILLWISLWQQILWAASTRKKVEAVPDRDVLRPDGDIITMIRKYLPKVQQPTFLKRVEQRRNDILENWRTQDELKGWVRLAKAWKHL